MSNIQTGAERMPHDLSHLGFLAGQIGRLITISTTPVIAGDSFEMDAVGALRLSPLRRGLAIDSTLDSSTLYFDSFTVNAGNGGFLHCIQMDTSVNAANQVVSVGADIAFDADPKFFACLVRFESSSVPTTLPTAYDVYPLDGR